MTTPKHMLYLWVFEETLNMNDFVTTAINDAISDITASIHRIEGTPAADERISPMTANILLLRPLVAGVFTNTQVTVRYIELPSTIHADAAELSGRLAYYNAHARCVCGLFDELHQRLRDSLHDDAAQERTVDHFTELITAQLLSTQHILDVTNPISTIPGNIVDSGVSMLIDDIRTFNKH